MPNLNVRDLIHELTKDYIDQTWTPVVWEYTSEYPNGSFYYIDNVRVIDGRLEINLGDEAPTFPEKREQ